MNLRYKPFDSAILACEPAPAGKDIERTTGNDDKGTPGASRWGEEALLVRHGMPTKERVQTAISQRIATGPAASAKHPTVLASRNEGCFTRE
jgi:hypothetical protein